MSHITVEQRYEIQTLLKLGCRQCEIASRLGKDKSVISRELKRNRLDSGKYKADCAQGFYAHRRKNCAKPTKWRPDVAAAVEREIRNDKSPEQIHGVMRRENRPVTVSHESIYRYIWADKRRGGTLHTHLRNRGRRYRKRGGSKGKRGVIPNRTGIEKRPEAVDLRGRPGDWEIDLVIGLGHKSPLLTIVDRATGYGIIRKLDSKEAEHTAGKVVEALTPFKQWSHTVTSDNGREFAKHETVAEGLGIAYYFANPYHSWERGSNENFNRLVRQYFPKKTDFSTITDEEVRRVQDKLNNRERKRLDFVSPNQYLCNLSLTKVAFGT